MSEYFSVQYRNWVLEDGKKVTGIIFGIMYRNFKIVHKEEYYHYLGDNDVRTLIRYTLDSIFCLINVANDQSKYKIHISDNEFVIIINRCLKDLKIKNPTVFIKTFGSMDVKVTIEDVRQCKKNHEVKMMRDTIRWKALESFFSGQ